MTTWKSSQHKKDSLVFNAETTKSRQQKNTIVDLGPKMTPRQLNVIGFVTGFARSTFIDYPKR